MNSYATCDEIRRQPQTWDITLRTVTEQKDRIREWFRKADPEEVIFTGCGASYYLSVTVAHLFQKRTGISAKAVPASDVMLHPLSVIHPGKRTALIGSSRSGDTTELVQAMNRTQQQDLARCLAVTSHPSSRLARLVPFTISLPHTREKSVVMTGSFTNILLTHLLIMAFLSDDPTWRKELHRLPTLGEKGMGESEVLARKLGADPDADHMIYLGLGPYYGLACEGMLIMKEMTQIPSEAYNSLEFRHGPISVLNDRCRVFLLSSRTARPYEKALETDLHRHHADVVVIGENPNPFGAGQKLELPPSLSDSTRSLLYLPLLQWTAYYRTLALGLNPDQPRNLNQVVRLKDEGDIRP